MINRYLNQITIISTLFCLIVLLPTKSKAQAKIGLKLGPSFSTFKNLDAGDPNYKFSPSVGVAIKFRDEFKRKAYLQTELYYIRKGTITSYGIDNIYLGDVRYNLHYVEMPIMVNVKLGRAFQVEAGGYGSALIGSDFDFRGTFFNGYGGIDDRSLNKWDYGLVLGFGFSLPRRTVSLRYYHGLADISTDMAGDTFLDGATNGTFQISFVRFFGNKKRS